MRVRRQRWGNTGGRDPGLREKIRDRINSVAETRRQREAAEADRGAAKSEVAAKRETLMAALRLPHAVHPDLSDRLTGLRDNLDRLRLPENTSSQFFEELVHEDECICGRPMDEAAVAEIKARAEGYLDSDDAGVINAMKQDIKRYTGTQGDEEEDAGYARVLRLRGELSEALRKERLADQRVRVLMERLIEAGDKELEAWQEEVEEKEARHKACGDPGGGDRRRWHRRLEPGDDAVVAGRSQGGQCAE